MHNTRDIYNHYMHFKSNILTDTNLTVKDVEREIKALNESEHFFSKKIGESFLGKPIFECIIGQGDINIIAWSQMHGDEHTGTKSMFDVFRFLFSNDCIGAEMRNIILKTTKIHFIPMLNPDGAQFNTRENAQNIDINRDARSKTTPEGMLLTNYAIPSFNLALNLHDQNKYFSAGKTLSPSNLAFFAPPYDTLDSFNSSRKVAGLLIADTIKQLIPYAENRISKWNDTFEPRAFGEFFQSKGISTILIESGFEYDDSNKEQIRKLTFLSILNILYSISNERYNKCNIEDYFTIPLNRENGMFDIIKRNQKISIEGKDFQTDIGYRNSEIIYGDLKDYGAYKEI
ncbi:M14 family zinc carboxypeptidase [Parabacteroides sp. PF5-9]|uniref:M14 family zinc carboxypeptidase n=1 Tax=Parabacteroides sp. PF5-9 TaxID=1742404 RepID=UPI0024753963|nr:M14 family zinc carboxypeptidase [Parabacteroides sp. PF5-9]MDH6356350.1 hypothetical protein [Parabacteroides sp. PF5-9]